MFRSISQLSFVFLITLFSCESSNPTSIEPKEAKEDTVLSFEDIKPKEDLPEPINDANCVERLTQYGLENQESKIKITTSFGNITLRLYKDTPIHRANFIQVINKGIYKDTQFSRVVKGFVIQGGSSMEKEAANKKYYLGQYRLPSEITMKHVHKYGALAMSREYDDNPEKLSDSFIFYIVVGEKMGDRSLHQIQLEKEFKYSEEQLHLYKTKGGTPHLDMEHTVFGEVISGMSVVEKINNVEVDPYDWPKKNIVINFEVLD